MDDNRRVSLERLKEQADTDSLKLMGYCLMSNHVHIIAIPHAGRPLGRDSFLSKLERLLGRRVRPLPVGRPKKNIEGEKRKTNTRK